ncbi:MAG: chemotaxis protein CheB [Xenococcaceae cyanobacterium]
MSDSPEHNFKDDSSESTEANENIFVVGIGASAGGLSALEELFSNLATDTGAAFVVIQHLSPDFKSLMKELLERQTSMAVYRVTEGMKLQPNSVYLIPPGQNLALEKNVLHLEDRKKDKNKKHELNFPIDLFFTSLAKNYGEHSIGIILSGTGSDGTRGLKAINEAGGVALVQDPKTAEFDGMPVSALATGVVNQVLPPRELAQLIYQCVVTPVHYLETKSTTSSNLINAGNLSQITKLLMDEEELDFSQYKSSTISRRVYRRCLIHNLESIDEYIKLLSSSSEERQILCSDLLINVTHFFRDYPAWQQLENNILPRLIAGSEPEAELRFWITACSTGEEAYSLAILVHEALQDSDKKIQVKIFATDIDRSALEKASQGIYPSSIATDIGSERLLKYFVARDNSYQVMRKIREMLIFSPHDLTKDAGLTRINLVTCRNVLIYMKSDLQDRVLRNLHFSLVPKGILFLGEAETLGEFASEFEPLDKKWKFYQKLRNIKLPLPLKSNPRISKSSSLSSSQAHNKIQFEPILEQCLNRLAEESDSIILLVSRDNHLLHVSGDSSKIFKAPDGKVTTEVIKMVVLPLQLPLSTALHRAKQQEKSVLYQGIKLEERGEILNVSVEVIPPQSDRRYGDFFLVKIKQELAVVPLAIPEAEHFELGSEASRRIMELENELQQTRENLQALVEELETTNEEQQASNEELTASNEELQSTNEELHSVNEELHTVNIEYQSKINELTQLNDDVDNLLQSTEIGVVFLDSELKIRKFTPAATTAIALRLVDVDRPLADLYWKFDCPNLFDLLHEVLATKKSKELEVKLKQTESYLLMQIHLYQTESEDNEGLVICFIKIDEMKQAQLKLEREIIARQRSEEQLKINQEQLIITQERVENIFSSLEDAIWSFELPEKKLGYLNTSFAKIYGRSQEEFTANLNLWLDVVHPEDKDIVQKAHRPIKQQAKIDLEYRILHPDGSIRWVRDRSKVICDDRGTPIRQDFVISDLTEQRQAQQALKEKERSFQAIFNSLFQFIGLLTPEGILLEANQTSLDFGGLTPEEVINRPFWEAKWWTISEATQEQLKQAIARAARGKFVRYEVDVLGAEDRVATIDFSLKSVMDEQGKVVQLISEGREIGEIKQAREELQQINLELEQRVAERTQSLAQFSDRLEQLHRLAIGDRQSSDNFLADYLQAGCQMLGMATGIVSEVNKCIYKIISVQSPLALSVGYETPCTDTYCAEVVETKTTVTFAEVGKLESMQNHPVYLNFKLESFIGTPIFVDGNLYGTLNFSDTTPRESGFTSAEIKIVELMARDIGNSLTSVRAEEALKRSELHFRNTFEQAAVGIAHVSPEGNFTEVNQRLCHILGYENDALLSKTFPEITHPEDLERDLEYVQQMLAGEIKQYSTEKRYFKADGSILWANLTFSLVRDNLDQPDYFISVIEDISDRKKIEIDLAQSRLKLEQANQAKDNFIAHMSHELRTPLNSLIGFSHILKKDSRLMPEQLKSVETIHRCGQHLLTLINDVLDLSKLTANKLKINYSNFDLAHFIHNITSIFAISTQDKGLDFLVQISDDLPAVVNADETKLRQVLFNLLSNGVKFTPTGTVTLSVSCLTVTPGSKVKTVRFKVEDTGIGIPENKHEAIFIPFEQINQDSNESEGTGLGLSICQNILQLMNSKLHLASKVGQGSRFWFDLDLEELSSHSLPLEVSSNEGVKEYLAKPYKVLVVDDNEDNRILLLEHLKSLGFILKEAEDGREGFEIAQEFQPDVILVDLLMPVMNGQEMIAAIRKDLQLQDTVILMISANIQSIRDSSALNCDGFLAKPVDLDELLELLEQHLHLEWQVSAQESRAEIVTEDIDLVVPPEETLKKLLELANLGQMKGLKQQIDLLVEIDSQYIFFANKIRQLVDNYQQDKLIELIESFI